MPVQSTPTLAPTKQEQMAYGLLEKHKVIAPAVPVERIAKQEGARIQFGPLDNKLSGMVFFKDGVPVIGVNSLHHPNRQRFTIAHELGHLMLHRTKIETGVHVDKELAVLRRDALAGKGIDPIEMEANQFAALLLVPDVLLEQTVPSSRHLDDEQIEALAKRFKVSTVTMQFRLQRWLEKS
jgi:Zn-dependent peptidase ImmA (M78 family)